jgi:hypothetical protein
MVHTTAAKAGIKQSPYKSVGLTKRQIIMQALHAT